MPTTAKHGLNSNSIVHSIPTMDGGDLYVVSQPNCWEFMVCDADGRTRKFSDNCYGNPQRALYEGLQWYWDNE